MAIRLVPLGGLGEFGANSMLLESEAGERLLLDAGVAFGDFEPFGVAYEVPDFAALGEPPPRNVVLTHAHDDHVKAVLSLLEAFPDLQVWGSRATLARVRHAFVGGVRPGALHELSSRAAARIGGFEVQATEVSHSVPGTLAVRLAAATGTLVIATDLRLAPSALGEQTPREVLRRWGEAGVGVLLLDGTNALVKQAPPSEGTVGETLSGLVREARGAVVAVTFASHVGRFRQLAITAAGAGRLVVPVGRGLLETLEVEGEEGGLGLPLGLVRCPRELGELPRERVVVVATGSQGEPTSAFSRLAVDLLAGLRLQPGDLVIHAARAIPGSERRLARLFDHCVRRGARVVTAAEAPIHASGHAHRAELATLLELLRPGWVLPVHGRRRNLAAVAELALGCGCRTLVAENGQEMVWNGEGLALTGEQRGVGRILLDAVADELLDPAALHHRRIMAQEGVVVAVLACARDGGTPLGEPRLHAFGFDLGEDKLATLAAGLAEELRHGGGAAGQDPEWLRSTMTTWLRHELRRRTRRRPAVVALVMEL